MSEFHTITVPPAADVSFMAAGLKITFQEFIRGTVLEDKIWRQPVWIDAAARIGKLFEKKSEPGSLVVISSEDWKHLCQAVQEIRFAPGFSLAANAHMKAILCAPIGGVPDVAKPIENLKKALKPKGAR